MAKVYIHRVSDGGCGVGGGVHADTGYRVFGKIVITSLDHCYAGHCAQNIRGNPWKPPGFGKKKNTGIFIKATLS